MAWSELRAEKGLSCSAQACTSADAYDGSENADETSTMKKSRTCRMSFRGSHVGSLLSPCNCRGTIGLVHKECLEEWLSRRNTDECSICSYQFEVERPPISILDWIREPRRQGNLWCILVEMLLSLLGTILLLVSAFLFAVQAFSGISPVLGCVLTGIIMVLAGLMCIAHIYLMVFNTTDSTTCIVTLSSRAIISFEVPFDDTYELSRDESFLGSVTPSAPARSQRKFIIFKENLELFQVCRQYQAACKVLKIVTGSPIHVTAVCMKQHRLT
ncbi:hypothetical protein V5799_024975 [Amblyomma americanum]|uniref:RING-CH-type domain-containing protein n=1 Tax=Amblyomma americanum TaxID=6943 RepID=A0AAQ4EAW6_AMBAM